MKQKFAEFLFKRIGSKMDELPNVSSSEEMQYILDDLDSYITALKEIVTEVIKP